MTLSAPRTQAVFRGLQVDADGTIRRSDIPGWSFQPAYYGLIHGWKDDATGRCAMVERGPDSLERAQALLAAHPDAKGICDALAVRCRNHDWNAEDDES